MRCIEHIVESPYERYFPVFYTVRIYSKFLLGKYVFWYAIMVVKSCLCSPAQMQCGESMSLTPLHYPAYFIPVIDLFILHKLDRCSCYYKSVKISVFYVIKSLIKLIEVTEGCMRSLMCGRCHKGDIDLDRSIRQRTQYLQLRVLLKRHEIYDRNLELSDTLMLRPVLIHHEYVFSF